MRVLLLLIACALLAGTGWFAATRGLDRPGLRGLPQIERALEGGARAALAAVPGTGGIVVETAGRDLRLSGIVETAEARAAARAAAAGIRLLGDLDDDIAVVGRVSPFTFSAARTAGGGVMLGGHVPDRRAEDAVLGAARVVAGGAQVSADLRLATGAPPGDWAALARAGIAALAPLDEGRFELSDLDAHLTGRAPDPTAGAAAVAATEAAAGAVPGAVWRVDVSGIAPAVDPYRFSALRMSDGTVVVDGHAPDAATRDRLMAAVGEVAGGAVEGTLTLAAGMPGPGWPDRVRRGLAALGFLDTGLLAIAGQAVTLSGEVSGPDALAAVRALTGPDWETDIASVAPPVAAVMTLSLGPDGQLALSGTLPPGLDPARVAADLGATAGTLAAAPGAPDADWAPALDALRIVLPRLESATATVSDRSLALGGALRRGFSAAGSDAAVRTVMPRTWSVALNFDEKPPLAAIDVTLTPAGRALDGVLPRGLEPADAGALLGADGTARLVTGGDGDAAAWRTGLAALAEGLARFAEAEAAVTDGSIMIGGRLLPGYSPNALQERLRRRVAAGWTVGLTAEQTPATDGDLRTDLASGARQRFRDGFWLPELDFPVSAARCTGETDAALAGDEIVFLTGSARIDRRARALLNRLAAIAARCLEGAPLRLEIAGHTDSVGNDTRNLALSEDRASAVRAALLARGVPGAAIVATGYGEARPVASNDTLDGRARNRRIGFAWTAAVD